MKVKLYCYPRCSTCKKSENYLKEKGISYEYIDIKKNPPTLTEISDFHQQSQLPIKRFFNTSGNSYRALNLSKTMDQYSETELYELLSKDGMLIKRPILIINEEFAGVGFKESEWDSLF